MSINTRITPRKDAKSLLYSIEYHIRYTLGKTLETADVTDKQHALALAAREFAMHRMLESQQAVSDSGAKRVYYLSLEFLIGRLLHNNLCNLGLLDLFTETSEKLGWNLTDILENELDPALGNGGLGRLAACFLDSLATLGMPGYGYGINYEFGLFRQSFVNGFQRENPDHWMVHGSPWQIERQDEQVVIPVYGRIEHGHDTDGHYNPQWVDWQVLVGVPHDIPVVGYGDKHVNYLRLFSARSSDEFDMSIFNEGDYLRAVEQKIASETVSKVLYPSDSVDAGKELRLIQEYFFVACALRDITRRHFSEGRTLDQLPDYVAIQLNDTHPALAVPELMRMLIDEHGLGWNHAWNLTRETLSYTNHTLLPEALEKWPVELVERILPRHMQLIYEINRRFLDDVATKYPNDDERLQRMSIIEESPQRRIRMANLSIVGSHAVNGVAAMHTELVKANLVPDFYNMWPGKFQNKTNGVTQRRWLHGCNKGLANLISENIGEEWITDLDKLRDLEPLVNQPDFKKAFRAIKLDNKRTLAAEIHKATRIEVDPNSMFDVQIKRIHEYKRQLLSALHIMHLYHRVADDGEKLQTPRTFVFSGKAAPGYYTAKLIVKLINNLAQIINNDPAFNDQIKVAFFPDYRVSVAEKIIPAADLSEQISTAGFEASGTGNMKLALNGALTIGTLDGANVEIKEEVGDEHIYIFGLTAEEVIDKRNQGYNPWEYYDSNPHINRVMNSLASDRFCPKEPGLFKPIFDNLLSGGDFYMHLADFQAYVDTQAQVAQDFRKPQTWAKSAILNVARNGKFSSDRTIRQYAEEIWDLDRKVRTGAVRVA